jgi:hypothetical protein
MSAASRILTRVTRMDREELMFRARVAARSEAARLASALTPRRWQRRRLAPRLQPMAGPLANAVERLEAGDWAAAHRSLTHYFHARESRFPLSPASLPAFTAEIRDKFPGAAADSCRRAEAITAGQFDLLGYAGLQWPTTATGDLDWHVDAVSGRRAPITWWSRVPYLDPASGDHKVTWELNRHQHWLALGRAAWLTGDRIYRRTFVSHVESWMRANPPLSGTNWASMLELSLRSISWLWALHLFVEAPHERETIRHQGPISDRARTEVEEDAEPWLVDLLLGLDRQLTQVEQNLSRYFSPNTHLTGEALGLYVCGRALPELVDASRWADTGRQVLLEQLNCQVAPDGGHLERAAIYHRYTLDFYLLALLMARVTDDACAPALAKGATRLAGAARELADAEGRLPLLGDDDGGSLFPICGRDPVDIRDSLDIAARLLGRPDLRIGPPTEEAAWFVGDDGPAPRSSDRVLGRRRSANDWASSALPDTGYYISRPSAGTHVVLDAGQHGYLNGGHAHADALSLTLTLDRLPLLIDPGTGTYTMSSAVRDRFRSSQMHNTVTIDGRSQSLPRGPFHWSSVANATLRRWVTTPVLDYFDAEHDGYAPLRHVRRVAMLPSGLFVITDVVMGHGAHEAELFWHLHEDWNVAVTDGGFIPLLHQSGATAWLSFHGGQLEILHGDETGLGWSSPRYGRLVPSTTLRISARAEEVHSFVTVIGAGPSLTAPRVDYLPVSDEAEARGAVAVRLSGPSKSDLMVFGTIDPLGEPVRCADLETDARFLYRLRRHGASASVAQLDGSYLQDLRRARPQVGPGGLIEGLLLREAGTTTLFS